MTLFGKHVVSAFLACFSVMDCTCVYTFHFFPDECQTQINYLFEGMDVFRLFSVKIKHLVSVSNAEFIKYLFHLLKW